MNLRRNWKENVTLIVACSTLFVRFLVQDSDCPTARGVPHQPATMILLAVSAFFSAHVVVDLASQYQPAFGWWLRGTLRWTFWWMLHALITLVAVGATVSALPVMSDQTVPILAAGIATILLVRQALRDYRAARHRFGSLARAEHAAAHANRRKRA